MSWRSNGQREPTITVRGLPAVIILALLAGLFAWQLLSTNEDVPEEVEERIREVLAAEYGSAILPGVESAMARNDEAGVARETERLLSTLDGVTFTSLKSRGGKSDFYVRAEIRVNGKLPPTGDPVRYFRFSHSAIVGYVYQEEAFAYQYYLPILD